MIDVVGYTENGDLQGFFVTYVQRLSKALPGED